MARAMGEVVEMGYRHSNLPLKRQQFVTKVA